MTLTNPNLPPLETQVSYLFGEMGTGDGGNIQGTFYNNPGMSASDAAYAFEQQFERSGGDNMSGRIANANNVYNAYTNGNLTSLPANAQYVFNQAIAQGYTPAQAAGIVGNLQAESGQGINPYAYNPAGGGNGANGIAQWRSSRYSNLQAYDPATGEVVPNTEVQAGDINPVTGEELTAEEAKAVRDEARAKNNRRRIGSLYKPNMLNNFTSYTYSWAVHIHHPFLVGKYSLQEMINQKKIITLAESGVENEISIDTVDQSMVLTYAKENRNSVANVFTINFIEAMGATFYTRIFKAAQDLRIENHLEACYILELNFRGWNEDGSSTPVIVGPYFYQTKLTKLTMDFRDGASFYTGNFIEVAEDAYSKLTYFLNSQVTVQATNFGDFLTKFETEVNKQLVAQALASDNVLLPNKYHFKMHPDYSKWASYKFEAIQQVENARGVSISISGGTLNITLPQGTGITAAIAMVLFQTAEFKRLVTANGFAKENSSDGEADAVMLAELVRWVSFETEVGYLNYDILCKHYQKDITFLVKGYITPEAVHDPASYINALSRTLQEDRLRNIFDNGLLRKRFDYTFTGLNTEILNLDITLNNVFYQLQAMNRGSVSVPADLFPSESEAGRVAGLKNTAAQLQANADRIRNKISSLQDENKRLRSEMDNYRGSNGTIAGQLEQNQETIREDQRSLNEIQRFADAARRNGSEAQLAYINSASGDVTALPSAAKRYITQDEVVSTGSGEYTTYLPNNFDFSAVQSLATLGPESPTGKGAAMLGALELNLNSTGDLIQQEMFIRGDPYWLGRPKGFEGVETQADYQIGGPMYFLNMEFPTYPSEQTGLSDNSRNFIVSGLYRVVRVNASYRDGRFEMTLSSFRDTNTDSEQMYENLIAGNVPEKANPAVTNRDRQNSTQNNPEVTDPNNRGSDNAIGGQVGNNTTSGNDLDADLNPDLIDSLEEAAAATGVAVRTTSGVRGPDPGASGRHQHGDASDTQLLVNGRVLSAANPSDRAIIQTFTQNYVAAARSRGYIPSVGWADTSAPQSQWYMDGNTGHYDIAVGQSVAANRGTYWGNGESADGAPAWLKNVMGG